MGAYKQERDAILKQFGESLAKRRQDKRISQEAFARIATVHRNEIGALERGVREPGLLMLLVLADAHGVSIEELTKDLPVPTARKPWPLAESKAAGKHGREAG